MKQAKVVVKISAFLTQGFGSLIFRQGFVQLSSLLQVYAIDHLDGFVIGSKAYGALKKTFGADFWRELCRTLLRELAASHFFQSG